MRTRHLLLLSSAVVGLAAACSSATGTGFAAGSTGAATEATSTGSGAPSGASTGGGSGSLSSSGGLGGSFGTSTSSGGGGDTNSAASSSGRAAASSGTGRTTSSSSTSGSASTSNGSGSSGSASSSTSGTSTSSSGGSPTFGTTCTGDTVLTGTVYAPNGIDPIPRVRVYIPVSTPLNPYPANYCDKCAAPLDPVYVSAFTAPDGTFSLNLDDVPYSATLPFAVQIGRFRKYTDIAVSCGKTQSVPQGTAPQPNWLPGATSATADIPKIAVSAGNSDHLDEVLNNLGITEYDCYEGRVAETGKTLAASTCAKPIAQNIPAVISDATTFGTYNMAFLSCAPNAYATFVTPTGQSYTEPGSTATYPGLGYDKATMTANTQAWVANGGRLFVTDTAYDYVAQAFPSAITWAGASGSPQPVDGANIGCAPTQTGFANAHAVTYPATINDATLATWLTLVGFPSSPSVDVVGFYEPWSVMSALPAGTTNIAQGTAMPLDATYPTTLCKTPTTMSVPLTADFDVPTCGRVLFSSYHTYTASGTTGDAGLNASANEKIMEYLIFLAATCSG